MTDPERPDVREILDRVDRAGEEPERRPTQTFLVRTEGAVRLLVDVLHTLDGIVWEARSADRAYAFVSPKSGLAFGYPVREWLTEPHFFLDHVHPEDRERALREARAAAESTTIRESEYRFRGAAGEWITIRDRFHGFVGPQESGIVLRGILFDVTNQRKIEDERNLLASAAEQTNDSVMITDTSGTIVYVNRAFERLSGYPRGEIVGRNPRILKSGRHGADLYERLWKTISRGDVYSGTLINRRRDGSLVEEEQTITPVRDPSGRMGHYVSIQRDVTREREIEKELRRSRAFEAFGPIAATVVGELNDRLSAIGLSIASARKLLPDLAPAIEPLERTIPLLSEAARTVSQLGNLAKRQSLTLAIVDLRKEIRETLDTLGRMIDPGIRIVFDLPSGPLPILGDPNQIEQILLELLVRARERMPGGGEIRVAAVQVESPGEGAGEPTELPLGRYVRIDFEDSGIVAPGEEGRRTPEPSRSPEDTSSRYDALHRVRGIVLRNGGALWVERGERRGTIVRIHFPAAHEGGSEPAVTAEAEPPDVPTILVADDDGPIRDALAQFLSLEGFRVVVAPDADAMLELLDSSTPRADLLVLDRALRRRSGEAVPFESIRYAKSIPTIVLSGSADSGSARELLAHGAAAYLRRPFEPDELSRLIRKALGTGHAG